MICFPNAKINLGLHILGKRADGYHDIETVFYPVPLKDALEIVPSTAGFSLTLSGIELDTPPENNLVRKAFLLFQDRYPHPSFPPPAVYLRKVIPSGAGLGGGSADAAFMLKLLDSFTGLHLPVQELEAMATSLGADCPFFIRNRPVIASGIGNRFAPVSFTLKGYTLCIVKPALSVSTKEAYSLVEPATPLQPLGEIAARPVEEWKERMRNDFELYLSRKYPVIREIRDYLYGRGAVYAALSGSGSAVFGLFEKDPSVSLPDCFVWKGMLE